MNAENASGVYRRLDADGILRIVFDLPGKPVNLLTPENLQELERILTMLAMEPRDLMRKGEKEYKGLGLDDPALDRAALIRKMVENPILIERPIVVKGEQAVIGRPLERVRELL